MNELMREIDDGYGDRPEYVPEGADIVLFRKRGYIIIMRGPEVYALVVHPAYRGEGVAKKLLAAAHAIAGKKLFGMVRADNDLAMGFHKSIGSREVGRLVKFEITQGKQS